MLGVRKIQESRFRSEGLAVLSALLLSLSFLPVGWWNYFRPFLAYFALTPLFITLQSRPLSLRRAAGIGYLFGLLLHLIGAYWLWEIGPVPYLCVALIEAGWFALFAIAFTLLTPRPPSPDTQHLTPNPQHLTPNTHLSALLFAALFTLFEWLRTLGAYAFPWFPLAATQTPLIPALQVCAVTGQWGLSFFVALGGALAGTAPRNNRLIFRALPVAAIVLALCLSGGMLMSGKESGKPLTVAVAQGAYGGDDPEESLRIYMGLAREAVQDSGRPLGLIVCPESTYWRELLAETYARDLAFSTAAALQTPILIGSDDTDLKSRRYNSAMLVGASGLIDRPFHKIKIVPLGEFFPFRDLLGPIYVKYPTGSNDLSPGEKPGTLTIATVPGRPTSEDTHFGTLICYESAFGWRARQEVNAGAEFLTVITNDAWFGLSAGPLQHADLSCLRAVETGRWVARAATSGESRLIDSDGRIIRWIPLMQHGTAQATIRRHKDQTLYARFGDWFIPLCGLAVVVAAALLRRK